MKVPCERAFGWVLFRVAKERAFIRERSEKRICALSSACRLRDKSYPRKTVQVSACLIYVHKKESDSNSVFFFSVARFLCLHLPFLFASACGVGAFVSAALSVEGQLFDRSDDALTAYIKGNAGASRVPVRINMNTQNANSGSPAEDHHVPSAQALAYAAFHNPPKWIHFNVELDDKYVLKLLECRDYIASMMQVCPDNVEIMVRMPG